MALITKRFCSLHSGVDWSVQSGPGKCPKRPGKISETALNLMRLLFSCFTQNLIKGPSIYDVHTEGGGGQAQVDACGRGRGSSPMRTSTQKIKIRVHRRHTVFFSCKEVGIFFTRISSLDKKKWKFVGLCDIN